MAAFEAPFRGGFWAPNDTFGLATAAWEAWTLFLCYALFYGLTEPAEKTLVANLVGNERRGLAYGWYNFAIGIATLPSSLIFGALYQFAGPVVAFGWGAALALIAGILMWGVKDPKRQANWSETEGAYPC